jgi:hypothetical protein
MAHNDGFSAELPVARSIPKLDPPRTVLVSTSRLADATTTNGRPGLNAVSGIQGDFMSGLRCLGESPIRDDGWPHTRARRNSIFATCNSHLPPYATTPRDFSKTTTSLALVSLALLIRKMTSFEALAKRMGSAGNSELLIVSFDIGTTQCMYSSGLSHDPRRADPHDPFAPSIAGAALAYIAPEGKGRLVAWLLLRSYPDVLSHANDRYHSIAPVVIEKLPGQTPGRAKVPSILLYSKG